MNDYKKVKKFFLTLFLHMCIMVKTLIAISTRNIEINFACNLLKTTFIAVENLIPSSCMVQRICNGPCNLI